LAASVPVSGLAKITAEAAERGAERAEKEVGFGGAANLIRSSSARFAPLSAVSAVNPYDDACQRPPGCITLITASVMASTPVLIVGSGTGANSGEWFDGSGAPPAAASAARLGS